jgi:hypothetical protein
MIDWAEVDRYCREVPPFDNQPEEDCQPQAPELATAVVVEVVETTIVVVKKEAPLGSNGQATNPLS